MVDSASCCNLVVGVAASWSILLFVAISWSSRLSLCFCCKTVVGGVSVADPWSITAFLFFVAEPWSVMFLLQIHVRSPLACFLLQSSIGDRIWGRDGRRIEEQEHCGSERHHAGDFSGPVHYHVT